MNIIWHPRAPATMAKPAECSLAQFKSGAHWRSRHYLQMYKRKASIQICCRAFSDYIVCGCIGLKISSRSLLVLCWEPLCMSAWCQYSILPLTLSWICMQLFCSAAIMCHCDYVAAAPWICMQIIWPQTAFYGPLSLWSEKLLSLTYMKHSITAFSMRGPHSDAHFILFLGALSFCMHSVRPKPLQIPSEWPDYALFTVMLCRILIWIWKMYIWISVRVGSFNIRLANLWPLK